MFVDNVIIISLIVGCLALFLFVAIFIAVFQRELGTKHCEKLEDGDVSEKQRLTPMPDEAQLEFTTETVQPESKTGSVSGYPHVQVNISSCCYADSLWVRKGIEFFFSKSILPQPNIFLKASKPGYINCVW